jgi:hypothetical protein
MKSGQVTTSNCKAENQGLETLHNPEAATCNIPRKYIGDSYGAPDAILRSWEQVFLSGKYLQQNVFTVPLMEL